MKKIICILLLVLLIPISVFSQETIHYDLSEMNEVMILSMLFQINMNPDFFLGTTIKISGRFFRAYSDFSDRYYNYAMFTDAAGCCQDGLEFLLTGKENIAENYPAQDEEITVIGQLDLLEIDGYTYPYLKVAEVY